MINLVKQAKRNAKMEASDRWNEIKASRLSAPIVQFENLYKLIGNMHLLNHNQVWFSPLHQKGRSRSQNFGHYQNNVGRAENWIITKAQELGIRVQFRRKNGNIFVQRIPQ